MKYKYDLAISFASEQRALAAHFATKLDASGYSIFYDEFHQAELWGQDLSVILGKIYSEEARYCLILLSKEYLEKPWTNHERRFAISQFIKDRSDYVLCLKIDDVDLPGFPSVMAYVTFGDNDEDEVYKRLLQKLGNPNHANQLSHLSPSDRKLAKDVIAACFRRAIYSRMDSEINLSAMYESIGMAIGKLLRIVPRIDDQALQFVCGEIINALDSIDRVQNMSRAGVSNHLDLHLRQEIDQNKMRIVRLLLEIRRAAQIPMQLPFSLRTDHFFSGADEPPESSDS